MKRILKFLIVCSVFTGCSTEYVVKPPEVVNKYDATKPQALTGFTPSNGGYLDNFVLFGNFGPDKTKMQVFFSNREAKIISSDGVSILAIVPKLEDGQHVVRVLVDGVELTCADMFGYTQVARITTEAGVHSGSNDFIDGTISQARFGRPIGIAVIADDNLLVVETHDQRIALVSFTGNQVTRLYNGMHFTKPAVNKARDEAYVIRLLPNTGSVFKMRRVNNWILENVRGNTAELAAGEQWACALDDSEKYLYVRNHASGFYRICLEEFDENGVPKVETLLTGNEMPIITGGTMNSLVWCPKAKCFYNSMWAACQIWKIWEENGVWKCEEYAGSVGGDADGQRLTEARFRNPHGMCVDGDGNLYVADANNHKIKRIDYLTGMVTTAAGSVRSDRTNWIEVDGPPLEATFDVPHCLAMDSEGNIWIANGEGRTIRKLSIE